MAKPKYTVLIDFNEDGDFTDSNEDVTSDVRRFKLTGGKRIDKLRADAGVLELFLNNDDHKYSPSFTSSPLFPNVFPAPNVWLLMGYPVDDFIAADTTTLTSRKPSHDDAFAAWEGDTGDFDVLSNKLRTAVGANKSAVLDFGETDCFVSAKFTRGGTGGGIVARWSDASNFLLIYHDGTNIVIGKVDTGSLSTISSKAYTWTLGTEKRIFVELHGDDIRVAIDDQYQLTTTSTFNNTATKHGVGGRATHADDRWSDAGGFRSKFYGRIDTIEPRPELMNQYAYIRAYDDFERAAIHQTFKSSPAATANAGDIVGAILDAIDFSSTNRILDNGSDLTTNTDHEKALTRNGLEELYQVQDDDVGYIFVDESGFYRYESEDHRDAAPHSSNIKTWRNNRAAGDETDIYWEAMEWDDGKQRVENEIYFKYFRISRTTNTKVWEIDNGTATDGDRPFIRNGATVSFLAVGDGDFVANAIVPRRKHTVDFNFNSAKDGTGTDLNIAEDSEQGTVTAAGSTDFTIDDSGQDFTAWNNGKHVIEITDGGGELAMAWIGTDDPDGDGTKVTLYTTSALTTKGYAYSHADFSEADGSLTYDVFNVSTELVSGFDGNFLLIRIVNGSGVDGYITLLQMFGDKGVKTSETQARVEDTASQLNVGRRRVQHEMLHGDRFGEIDSNSNPSDAGSAVDRAFKRLRQRSLAKEHLILNMSNGTRANLMQIVHRSYSDRIRCIDSNMTLDDGYILERKNISVFDGGLKVECDWELEAAIGQPWGEGARWDFFQWG